VNVWLQLLLLMYCSEEGLPEAEISQILGDYEKQEPITMLDVATLYRQLRPFTLLTSGLYGNRLIFYHNAVKEVCVHELLCLACTLYTCLMMINSMAL
jgi:hypothetical protein